ncbi:glycogen, partial [Cystoisospora suis]
FDLKKIHKHYEERRKLRQEEPCLQRGRLVLVDVYNPDGYTTLTQISRAYEASPDTFFSRNFGFDYTGAIHEI